MALFTNLVHVSQINKSDTAKIFNHSTFHLHRLSISNLSCIYQEKTAMTLSKIKKNNSWTVLNTKHLIGYKTLHAHMEDIKHKISNGEGKKIIHFEKFTLLPQFSPEV